MDINQYQVEACRTDKQHRTLTASEATVVDNALGLAGEAGEVVDLVKHAVFHQEGIDKFKLCKELGDVMWYLVHVAKDAGIPIDVVLQTNVRKLQLRYPNGYDDASSAARHKTEQAKQLKEEFDIAMKNSQATNSAEGGILNDKK